MEKGKVSIIIPSRNERFLKETVNDIFKNARGNFEVIVVLDEQDQPLEPRPGLKVVKKVGAPGMKSAICQGVDASDGEFIMKSDAHCMFGEGFDVILSAECESNWVVIPRRYSLEPSNWSIRTHRPIVDYEYIPFPFIADLTSVKTGGKWHARRDERVNILLDETMTFQGSVWFTPRQHFENMGRFEKSTTGDDFLLESEELGNKTWLTDGKVMVNKKTWYAHLHKGNEYGRMYFVDKRPMKRQRIWHVNYWWHNQWPGAKHTMEWLVDKFMPIPGYPLDYKDPKYEKQWRKENGLE